MLSVPVSKVTVMASTTLIAPVIDKVVPTKPVALIVRSSPAVMPPAVKVKSCGDNTPLPSFNVTTTSRVVARIAPRMVSWSEPSPAVITTSLAPVKVPAAVVDRVNSPELLLDAEATNFWITRSFAAEIAAEIVRLSLLVSLPRSKVMSPVVDVTVPLIDTVSTPSPVDKSTLEPVNVPLLVS